MKIVVCIRQTPDGEINPFDACAYEAALEIEDADITLSAEEREIGGLGIYMVKQMMEKVDYKYEDNKNIFTIRKNI